MGLAYLVMPALAVIFSTLGLRETSATLSLPPVWILAAMSIVGVFDAMSGFLSYGLWATVTLVSSGVTSAADIRFVIGVLCLGITPLLLASGVRALRRVTTGGGNHWWNRIVDVILAPIVAWWATAQILALLPSLAGVDIDVSAYSGVIPAAVAFSMVGRVALEEIAAQWFPKRLAETHEPAVAKPHIVQRWFGILLRAGIFYFAAGALIGDCWQLVVGTLLFILPNVLGIYSQRFPNSATLHKVLPAGVVNLTLGIFLGGVTLELLLAVMGPVEDLAKMAFVILPLPTLVISVLKLFGRSSHQGTVVWYENPKFAWPIRIGTLAIIVIFSYLIHLI